MVENILLIISISGLLYLGFAASWAIYFIMKRRYTKYYELYESHLIRKHSVLSKIQKMKKGV